MVWVLVCGVGMIGAGVVLIAWGALVVLCERVEEDD